MEKQKPGNKGHRALPEDVDISLFQAVGIQGEFLHHLIHPFLDTGQGLIITDIGNGIGNKSGNLLHVVFFQAMGGAGWRTNPDTGGNKRRTGFKRYGILVYRNTGLVQCLFSRLAGNFGTGEVDQHQVVVSTAGSQLKPFT